MALLEELEPRTQPIGQAWELLDEKEFRWPGQTEADRTVLKKVVQDAAIAESWVLNRMLPAEWSMADRLYHFKVPTAFWEGTTVERAHLGMPVVLEHIESILPQLMTGLFVDDPPFFSKPRPNTSMDAARANDAILSWELQRCGFREELRLGCKSTLLYGMGIWKWGWKRHTEKRKMYRLKDAEQLMSGPAGNTRVPTPGSDELELIETEVEINQPTFEKISIRHVLVDPSCRVGDIRKARYVIHVMYPTLNEIEQLRDVEGFELPPQTVLAKLFFPPAETPEYSGLETQSIDVTREFKAEPRSATTSIDPLNQPLEMLEYWTPDRKYVVLQKKLVICKQDNPWGVIPFLSLPYIDVEDSFWGIGIARLNGGEQRMQQGVMNAFLDELSLSLNGMFIRKRGTNTLPGQMRMRPGGVIDVDDEKGVGVLQRQQIPVEALTVIAQSDARAARRTAANELLVQGVAPMEKSSITRTATGANLFAGGTGTRLQALVETLANQVFIPVLQAFRQMNAAFLRPSQIKTLLNDELGQAYTGDVLDVVNAQMDFTILAAAKLQARRAMSQSLPFLWQFLLTEPVINGLQMQGEKINIKELVKMLFDVSGWPNQHDVIIPMTPDDEARAMMDNPAVQGMIQQQQQAQSEMGNKRQLIEEENIAGAGRDIIKAMLKRVEAEHLGLATKTGSVKTSA